MNSYVCSFFELIGLVSIARIRVLPMMHSEMKMLNVFDWSIRKHVSYM
jgi:hypothetical protein